MGQPRMIVGTAAVVSFVALSTPLAAGQRAQAHDTTPIGTLVQRAPQPTPYDALFLLPGQSPTPRAAPPRPTPEALTEGQGQPAVQRQPVIKCGVTLVPADPNVDPKIYAPRGPRDTRHAIRGVTPEICK